MFLGLDFGTTEVKFLFLSDTYHITEIRSYKLTLDRPFPLWSEQHPHQWWNAVCEVLDDYTAQHPDRMGQVQAIGLSGQMHGAVLLDGQGDVLRPAILWNDGRSSIECEELQQAVPDIQVITGNLVMAGFTAPKLCWVRKHEPDIFARVRKVLLPKDYIRFCLSGDYVSDCSDSAGTLWLDVAKRDWSTKVLLACGLTVEQMPRLIEGEHASGILKPELAKRWGMKEGVIIAGGAGDNASSAVGIGITKPCEGFVSLGTSGVVFVCNDGFYPHPDGGIHAFCHAVSNTWHQMAVMLSAASGLRWGCEVFGFENEIQALSAVEGLTDEQKQQAPIFLPYLSGERTPHNNPYAQGMFFGLTARHKPADFIYAILEGVSFGLLDGLRGLKNYEKIKSLSLVGGGAKSSLWGQLLADIFQIPMTTHQGSDVAGALGATRLACLALGQDRDTVCKPLPVMTTFIPCADKKISFEKRYTRFKQLYQANKQFFTE